MEQKITGLSPETHIHLSCRYHQFITTPLLHQWEAVQHHPSIQERMPFCISAHSLPQEPPVPILCWGEKPSALPTHDGFARVCMEDAFTKPSAQPMLGAWGLTGDMTPW